MGWKHFLLRPPLTGAICRKVQTGRFCGKFPFDLVTAMLSANVREIEFGVSARVWHCPTMLLKTQEVSGI